MGNVKTIKVALVGNPNTGKTSLFNQLTGLKQKVGNYPGITVEKKTGKLILNQELHATLIDLPGTYSLNPNSIDENIVLETLLHTADSLDEVDLVVVIADIENLKRNLLLFSQIKDLEIPAILAVNMSDVMTNKGIILDLPKLEELLQSKVVLVSARKGDGIERLKEEIANYDRADRAPFADMASRIDQSFFDELKKVFPQKGA